MRNGKALLGIRDQRLRQYRIGLIMIKNPKDSGRKRKPRGGHLLPDRTREHRYSRELGEEILRRLAAGEALTKICADPAIPVSSGAAWHGISTTVTTGSRPLMTSGAQWSSRPNRYPKMANGAAYRARDGDQVTIVGDTDDPIGHAVELDLTQLTDPELDARERFADARLAAKDADDLQG
jgi:hypothetical protein